VDYKSRNTEYGTGKRTILRKLNDNKKHHSKSAFTACTGGISLLETVTDAAKIVEKLATNLLSTARSSFDELQNARKSGLKLCFAAKSISWGRNQLHPNISGEIIARQNRNMLNAGNANFSFRAFLRQKHGTNQPINQSSSEKGRQPRQTNE